MRLDEAREKGVPWKQWGHTSANAYHWGEDGLGWNQRRPPGAVFCRIQRRSVLRRVGGVRGSRAFDLSEYDVDRRVLLKLQLALEQALADAKRDKNAIKSKSTVARWRQAKQP
jgi:hypothetical protein